MKKISSHFLSRGIEMISPSFSLNVFGKQEIFVAYAGTKLRKYLRLSYTIDCLVNVSNQFRMQQNMKNKKWK